jgi:hypothetical protein
LLLRRGELLAMTRIETEMLKALATYNGPVTRYRPGKARGAEMPKNEDRAQQWLNGHRDDVPLRDEKAERRRRRMARAERDRIAKRNAAVRKLRSPGQGSTGARARTH